MMIVSLRVILRFSNRVDVGAYSLSVEELDKKSSIFFWQLKL